MSGADRLIFIHGLWMTGAESRWLRRRLEADFGKGSTAAVLAPEKVLRVADWSLFRRPEEA